MHRALIILLMCCCVSAGARIAAAQAPATPDKAAR